MQNLSDENKFDLYENEHVGGTRFRMKTHFEMEAKDNPQMAYCCAIVA